MDPLKMLTVVALRKHANRAKAAEDAAEILAGRPERTILGHSLGIRASEVAAAQENGTLADYIRTKIALP